MKTVSHCWVSEESQGTTSGNALDPGKTLPCLKHSSTSNCGLGWHMHPSMLGVYMTTLCVALSFNNTLPQASFTCVRYHDPFYHNPQHNVALPQSQGNVAHLFCPSTNPTSDPKPSNPQKMCTTTDLEWNNHWLADDKIVKGQLHGEHLRGAVGGMHLFLSDKQPKEPPEGALAKPTQCLPRPFAMRQPDGSACTSPIKSGLAQNKHSLSQPIHFFRST